MNPKSEHSCVRTTSSRSHRELPHYLLAPKQHIDTQPPFAHPGSYCGDAQVVLDATRPSCLGTACATKLWRHVDNETSRSGMEVRRVHIGIHAFQELQFSVDILIILFCIFRGQDALAWASGL